MRLVVQRVKSARVSVADEVIAAIGTGLLVLVGFGREDENQPSPSPVLSRMARKLVQTRIFPNDRGRLDLDVKDVGGQVLAVSQFTLHADCRKGRRPSLQEAAHPDRALELFTSYLAELEALLPSRVRSGAFGREMDVELCNWGPLTLTWDSQTL